MAPTIEEEVEKYALLHERAWDGREEDVVFLFHASITDGSNKKTGSEKAIAAANSNTRTSSVPMVLLA